MATISKHGRRGYKQGCRCDLCKCGQSEYQRGRRQRLSESVGEFAGDRRPGLAVIAGAKPEALSCGNASDIPANTVMAGVLAQLEALGNHRQPGLAAAALSLAQVLDNPKAVNPQPAAAKVLASLLDKLRTPAQDRRDRLSVVRTLTEKGSGQGSRELGPFTRSC
jgi:hypothetical protein